MAHGGLTRSPGLLSTCCCAATSFSDPDLTQYFMLLLLECQAFSHNLKLDARQNINRGTTGRCAQAGGAAGGARSGHIIAAASLSRDALREWGLGAAGGAGTWRGCLERSDFHSGVFPTWQVSAGA